MLEGHIHQQQGRKRAPDREKSQGDDLPAEGTPSEREERSVLIPCQRQQGRSRLLSEKSCDTHHGEGNQ